MPICFRIRSNNSISSDDTAGLDGSKLENEKASVLARFYLKKKMCQSKRSFYYRMNLPGVYAFFY